jgi:hypothetical protein
MCLDRPTIANATGIPTKVKVKFSLCFILTEHQAMQAYWGVEL